jgi:hypothetical protein
MRAEVLHDALSEGARLFGAWKALKKYALVHAIGVKLQGN